MPRMYALRVWIYPWGAIFGSMYVWTCVGQENSSKQWLLPQLTHMPDAGTRFCVWVRVRGLIREGGNKHTCVHP